MLQLSAKEDITIDLEDLELELIEFEVEEVFDDEEGIIIYAPFEQFGAIQTFFEEANTEIISSAFERSSLISLSFEPTFSRSFLISSSRFFIKPNNGL